jgi:hypothetical protein
MTSDDALFYVSCALFTAANVYIFYKGQLATIGLTYGVAMILYAVTSGNTVVSLIAGALVGLIAVRYSHARAEGFEDADEDEAHEEKEGFEEAAEPKKKAPKKKRVPPPDNGDRREFLELGKKYKMPSEDEDHDIHLDAGTTFMNAYKSLKPDQVAAMTKDTQDLMQTQKQLMSTLQTLKPLMKDGKEMMDMFQSYFGAGQSSMT